ncbi:MAG: mechanosensitive ion channel domain-containing protein [Candidatus Sedimenticola sp. 20ELBAFRAG]
MFEAFDINQLTTGYVIPWVINIGFALVIFIFGRLIANALVKLLEKLLVRAEIDEILIKFTTSIIKAILLLFIIIAALDQLGVDTTSLIALLGAAGLAVGLALQNSLQNFAAGVMLIVFRPFKSGDFIQAGGTTGVVEAISIFSTILITADNREVIIPNSSIYSGPITNYSAHSIRRIDMVFGIGYEDDIKMAKETLQRILRADKRVLNDPEPLVAVAELADSSVNFNVRPWVRSGDYWDVKYELTEKIKITFDESGISIPYPQMDLHIDK